MATFRETWHFATIIIRWLGLLPIMFLGAVLALLIWTGLWLLENLALNPILILAGSSTLGDLMRDVLSFALQGQCPRCGWRVHQHAHEALAGHVPPSRLQTLREGPNGSTVLIDGWLARRAIAAVGHVEQLGGDPSVVAGTLFTFMAELTPEDIAQRLTSKDLAQRVRN
jgi:hypothetical protein